MFLLIFITKIYTSAVWRATRPVANHLKSQNLLTKRFSNGSYGHVESVAKTESYKVKTKNPVPNQTISKHFLGTNQIKQHQNKENLKDTKNLTKSNLDIKHNYVHNLYKTELYIVLKQKILENYTFLNGIVLNNNTNPQNLAPLQIIDENKNIYATFNVHSFNIETLDSSITIFLERDDVQKILKDGVESFYNTHMHNNTLDTSKLEEHCLKTANELLPLFYK
ncbi:hypothetical protein COBT_003135 [Conglomerata obtusa]